MLSDPGSHTAAESVEILRWPRDERIRRQLARVGVPRIVLREPGTMAPHDADDPAEVWVAADHDGSTVDQRDIDEIAARLLGNLQAIDSSTLTIDADGIARRGWRQVELSASEALVATALAARPGSVVSTVELEELLRAGADEPPAERALEGVMYRLRQRLVALHVVVRNVRSRGYVIDGMPPRHSAA